MTPQLHETLIGRKFLDHTMPEIARQLERVADVLEKINQGEIKITLALPTEDDVTEFIEKDTAEPEPSEPFNVEEPDLEKRLQEELEKKETREEKLDFVKDLLIQRYELLQDKIDILIEFLQYENAYTVDPKSEKRIREVLERISDWKKVD
jgi:hypothetical protein